MSFPVNFEPRVTARTVGRICWGPGPVGAAVEASERERLRRFVRDEESEPVALFSDCHRARSDSGDWYGEHAGKWLCAASLAHRRTGDPELTERIEKVADYLVRQQEADGYLGTYRREAACRFTSKGAVAARTWDLWVHAWMILGLSRVGRGEAAHRIGELILATFPAVHDSILDLGNHSGLSSMVLLQPLAELAEATGDERYLRLAFDTLEQAERRGLAFLGAADRDVDVADIGTGKAYQILWILVGMLSLYRATHQPALLQSVERLWENVSRHHLTPMGGPWGGIATHKEVFNAQGFFSPEGLVETCSATTWLILSRELFLLTGMSKYVEAVERTLLNSILGALDPNGRDWCYFTFPNGKRSNTYHWACCKSSGMLALEEAANAALTPFRDGLSMNLYEPFHAEATVDGTQVRIAMDDKSLTVDAGKPVLFPLYLRIPEWGRIHPDMPDSVPYATGDNWIRIEKEWVRETIPLNLAAPVEVQPKTYSLDHHGQEIARTDYACVSRGPIVYATGLFDGFRKQETLRLPRLDPGSVLREESGRIQICLPAREPIPMHPYRELQDWRTTWLQVAWQ